MFDSQSSRSVRGQLMRVDILLIITLIVPLSVHFGIHQAPCCAGVNVRTRLIRTRGVGKPCGVICQRLFNSLHEGEEILP